MTGPDTDPSTLLRAAAMLLLALLAVVGLPGDGESGDRTLGLPPMLRISPEAAEELGWPAVLRHAAEAPVTAVVSGRPPPVLLDPPRRVRAGRTAALRTHATEPVRVMLERPQGGRDTIRLEAGGSTAFLLRPLSEGWRTWRIAVEGSDGTVRETAWSALVEPARPLRILAVSGPPDTESRMALRALEEAGEQVEAWIHLGRDVWVGRAGGPLPDDAEAYAEADVIVLFPGISLAAPQALALVEAVRLRGKGLLLSATDGGTAALRDVVASLYGGGGWQRTVTVGGDSLAWSLPPEVTPLPPASVTASVRAGDAEGMGTSQPSPLRLTALGRGRVGVLALADTWRWRMEAGAADAHLELWEGTVSWLAGGYAEDPVVEVLGAGHRAGSTVHIRRLDAPFGAREASSAPRIAVSGPEGDRALELAALGTTPGGRASAGAFVPMVPGGYVVEAADPAEDDGGAAVSPALGVAVVDPAAADLDPSGRLARIAVASPGGAVVLGDTDAARERGAPERGGLPWRAILFTVLTILLPGAWLHRRLAGRP